MNSDDLYFTSAVELSSLVRDKQISPATPATSIPIEFDGKSLPIRLQVRRQRLRRCYRPTSRHRV
jgi:hypothetical protein